MPQLDQVLSENPRLIVVFSHSAPLSWIPAPCLLTAHVVARGGGRRRPIAVMDRFFYSVPGLRAVAKYVAQSDRPLSFKELVQHFEKMKTADLVVFPEGSNCFFGDPAELQPFRSHRFVEIGIRTKSPLLLCVHRGSEKWGKSWKLPMALAASVGSLFGTNGSSRLASTRRLTIPMWPAKMDRFSMLCELYQPEGDAVAESEKVHARMQEMLRELDASS
ncbi:hypothetical protein BH10BDE1_BH10BDE1_36570 [soil metagenome]